VLTLEANAPPVRVPLSFDDMLREWRPEMHGLLPSRSGASPKTLGVVARSVRIYRR